MSFPSWRGKKSASAGERHLPLLIIASLLLASACVFSVEYWTGSNSRAELGVGTPASILLDGGYSLDHRRNAASQWVSDSQSVIRALENDPELSAEWKLWKDRLRALLKDKKEQR
jgi:hypothetical protein